MKHQEEMGSWGGQGLALGGRREADHIGGQMGRGPLSQGTLGILAPLASLPLMLRWMPGVTAFRS